MLTINELYGHNYNEKYKRNYTTIVYWLSHKYGINDKYM